MANNKRIRGESGSSAGSDKVLYSPRPISEGSDVHTPKYASLDNPTTTQTTMRCSLAPHKPMSFPTYYEYETHYRQAHTNCCAECNKNFPTAHFLELHIAENHDPIIAAKLEQGEKTFVCFVEGCEKVCSEWKKRRSHLVDKHGYPRNYDFFIVKNGIDGRRSMLRSGVDAHGHRRSSRERSNSFVTDTNSHTTEVSSFSDLGGERTHEEPALDAVKVITSGESAPAEATGTVDALTQSMSSLRMVPRSVTFGKKGRAGFAKS